MVKKALMFIIVAIGVFPLFAQDVLLADTMVWKSPKTIYAYEKHHVRDEKRPDPFANVRECDVVWSKRVWRKIVLAEKQNHRLYYPTKPIGDRKSLGQIILDAIKDIQPSTGVMEVDPNCYDCITPPDFTGSEFEGARALIPFTECDFKTPMLSLEEVNARLSYDLDGEPMVIEPSEISAYVLLEDWFIDKKRSQLDVRIIGIQPEYYRNNIDANGNLVKATSPTSLFWLYFPQLRYYLCKYECYNSKNDAARWTFDDLFVMRYFSSYIIREENVYDNRFINDYMRGVDALLESEKIKQQIMHFEFDLWEY